MTRTISSERQCGLGWPPEADPFDDDVDENGDWIAVPEVEVISPGNDHEAWMSPKFYRLGPTPKLDVLGDISAPNAADDPFPHNAQSPVETEDEPAKTPAAGDSVKPPDADETTSANITQASVERQHSPDPTPQVVPLTASERHRLDLQTVRSLSKQAAAGDQSALDEIRVILDSNEDLWRYLGNVEQTTLDYLISVLLDVPDIKESTRRTVAELKASLLSPNPTPLEKLAVGRVTACWLFTHIVDRRVAHAIDEGDRVTGLPKLVEASEKRLHTAMKSLKLVRGMNS